MQVKCFNNKKISFTMSKEMIAVMSRCVKKNYSAYALIQTMAKIGKPLGLFR